MRIPRQVVSRGSLGSFALAVFMVSLVGVAVPALDAQRETPPAGVSNYTRVDATVACGGTAL